MEKEFVYRAGELALDYINTQIKVRNIPVDLLESGKDLEQWWREIQEKYRPRAVATPEGSQQIDAQMLAEMKEYRAALRRIFSRIVAGEKPEPVDLDVLNEVLASGHEFVKLNETGEFEIGYQVEGEGVATIKFEIARSALTILTGKSLDRLHQCQNERCILYFYDSTKSATRHWCSQSCMNRSRSIRNYRESKKMTL